jgi:3-oxoacyl-[acyl-carrier protein] reductase
MLFLEYVILLGCAMMARPAVSVVAGGSAGIGLATARRLASGGGRVALLARGSDALEAATHDVGEAGAVEVLGVRADARDEAEVQDALAFVGGRWGEVNALVCTMGPNSPGRFEDLDDATWMAAFDEGVLGPVRCIRHALPLLRRAEWARIVTVTALSVKHQSPGLIAYTAAKAALASVTKNLARTLAPEGILVNAVAPGPVLTGSIRAAVRHAGGDDSDVVAAHEVLAAHYGSSVDLGRVGQPEELAEVIAFCASRQNSFMTGSQLNVDGGSDFA